MSAPRSGSRRRLLGAAAAALACPWAAAQEQTALERIRRRGSLVVGVYQDMPPFHVGGAGIDVEIARGLAERLGHPLQLLPFHADENMNDDLRHMVWRGHYLGWGPADVLLHVPVDAPLMNANPRVQLLAPYYRERVAIAWRRERGATLESLADLRGQAVAVAGQSLAGWLMIGAEGGLLRDSLRTRLADGSAAARALRDGEVVAAGGLSSELESVLGGDPRFVVGPLPVPRAPRDGWAVGCAVRKESQDLAQALQAAMRALADEGRLRAVFAERNVRWVL